MAVHHTQKLSRGTVLRNGVRSRFQAVVRVITLSVCVEYSSEVVFYLVGILLLVEACNNLANAAWWRPW